MARRFTISLTRCGGPSLPSRPWATGDTYPVTAAGRGVAVVLMLVGIGLIGVLTATVASFFVQEGPDKERDELITRLERIEAMLEHLVPEGVMIDGALADSASKRQPSETGAHSTERSA
jgi:Ion channel